MMLILTGASGVGKTTLLSLLKNKLSHDQYCFYHFDDCGVPPLEEMTREYGSASLWQKAMTHRWISQVHKAPNVILEGQMNLDYIQEALEQNHARAKIVLVSCDENQMVERLQKNRAQPELANDQMKQWRTHLQKQALRYNVPILDTSVLSPEQAVDCLLSMLAPPGPGE